MPRSAYGVAVTLRPPVTFRSRAAALAAALCLAGCAAGKIDYSKRTADRLFLRKGLTQSEVIAAWGKPDSAVEFDEKGEAGATWEYDRIYRQKESVAYWPRSQFALTFVGGKLRRWVEREP